MNGLGLAAVLVVGWPALVMAWCHRHRPRRPGRIPTHRNQRSAMAADQTHPGPGERTARALAAGAERLGTILLTRAGRTPTPPRSRRLGTTVVLGLAAAPASPWLAVALAGSAWTLPAVTARRYRRRRQQQINAALPDTVDLVALAVGAGLTVALAVRQVGRRGTGPVAAEMARAGREADLGRRLADALDDITSSERGGEACRGLISVLVASERYGAPIGPGLDRLSTEVRAKRRRQAEESARKVPVKLLFPLVTCTLPAFALLTVAPLIASALESLRL